MTPLPPWIVGDHHPTGPAGGDLDGVYPNPGVAQLQGKPVSNAAPAANQVLTWNGAAWAPAAAAGGAPTGAAGGDLSGSYPNPGVAQLQGKPVSNAAPAANQVLTWNGAAWAPAAAAGGAPTGAAGGDLSGNYPNPGVAQLQGRAVSNTAPAANQVLTWNGAAWAPAAPAGGAPSGPAGGDLSGNYPNPGVAQLQGNPVSNTAPVTSQSLAWNGAAWAPGTATSYNRWKNAPAAGSASAIVGNFTIPAGTSAIHIRVTSAAGGGGGGANNTSAVAQVGGAGGAAGSVNDVWVQMGDTINGQTINVGTKLYISLGAGGLGGAGGPHGGGAGSDGGLGGDSAVGLSAVVAAPPDSYIAYAVGSLSGFGSALGTTPKAGASWGAGTTLGTEWPGCGGASGGGAPASPGFPIIGGSGGGSYSTGTALGGGGGGACGTAANPFPTVIAAGAAGGSTTSAGAAGSNATVPGCGGGGGGGGANNSAGGMVEIWTM